MDFFFGGVVKNKLYEKNPKTVNDFKYYIYDTFREIDENEVVPRCVSECFGQV